MITKKLNYRFSDILLLKLKLNKKRYYFLLTNFQLYFLPDKRAFTNSADMLDNFDGTFDLNGSIEARRWAYG